MDNMNEILPMIDALWQLIVKYQVAVVIAIIVLSGLFVFGVKYFWGDTIEHSRLGRIWISIKLKMRDRWFGRNFDFWASVLSPIAFLILCLLFDVNFWESSASTSETVSSETVSSETVSSETAFSETAFSETVFSDTSSTSKISFTSNTEKARNFLIVLSLFFGFPILIKRVTEMQKQTRISQFSDAIKFLWDKNNGARMASIATLWRLAEDYPTHEYKKVMNIFTSFLRNPPPYELDEELNKRKKEKYAILKSVKSKADEVKTPLGRRKDAHAILGYMKWETIKGSKKVDIDLSSSNLEGAHLKWSHLEGANFKGANLRGANLSNSYLRDANLSSSNLEGANLFWSHLEGANLSSSNLEGADLFLSIINGANLSRSIINGADFTDAIGLTQEQIDECVFITDSKEQRLPKLPAGINPTYKRMTREEWVKLK